MTPDGSFAGKKRNPARTSFSTFRHCRAFLFGGALNFRESPTAFPPQLGHVLFGNPGSNHRLKTDRQFKQAYGYRYGEPVDRSMGD